MHDAWRQAYNTRHCVSSAAQSFTSDAEWGLSLQAAQLGCLQPWLVAMSTSQQKLAGF